MIAIYRTAEDIAFGYVDCVIITYLRETSLFQLLYSFNSNAHIFGEGVVEHVTWLLPELSASGSGKVAGNPAAPFCRFNLKTSRTNPTSHLHHEPESAKMTAVWKAAGLTYVNWTSIIQDCSKLPAQFHGGNGQMES
jgi:hypothetical protein